MALDPPTPPNAMASSIETRGDFFDAVPGGPVFLLAERLGLLDPKADIKELCAFYEEHREEIEAHRAQIRRERDLENLPSQRRGWI